MRSDNKKDSVDKEIVFDVMAEADIMANVFTAASPEAATMLVSIAGFGILLSNIFKKIK